MAGAFSGHSLRSGYCTAAAMAGVPEWKIRRRSRHRTAEMVARYVRAAEEWTGSWPGPAPRRRRPDRCRCHRPAASRGHGMTILRLHRIEYARGRGHFVRSELDTLCRPKTIPSASKAATLSVFTAPICRRTVSPRSTMIAYAIRNDQSNSGADFPSCGMDRGSHDPGNWMGH